MANFKRHFHERFDVDRAACGEPLGSRPYRLASSNPKCVTCLRCRRVLASLLAATPVKGRRYGFTSLPS